MHTRDGGKLHSHITLFFREKPSGRTISTSISYKKQCFSCGTIDKQWT